MSTGDCRRPRRPVSCRRRRPFGQRSEGFVGGGVVTRHDSGQLSGPSATAPNPPATAVNVPPPGPPAAIAASGGAPVRPEFTGLLQAAVAELTAEKFDRTHLELSKWYDNPALTPEEARQLTELLDKTAGTLIYSTRHLLEPAYRVQPGDTLDSIGRAYNVPGELLAKINGISDPRALQPGRELKVVRGPFEARINLQRRELTLFFNRATPAAFPSRYVPNPPCPREVILLQKKLNNGSLAGRRAGARSGQSVGRA